MKYFKNIQAAQIFHVSEKSIRNWIEATRSGKLGLELHEENGKFFVANTTKNTLLIQELVQRGQKYKNSRGHKVISPLPEFYELYSPQQIFDIFSNLDIHREMPLQYTYFDRGAEHWDLYSKRLFEEDADNTLKATINLLNDNFANIERYILSYNAVNVIDIGVGNAMPVKKFLHQLMLQRRLKRYIGIDISEKMLSVASKNIEEWFGDIIAFERYVKDINYDHFQHVLAEDAFSGVAQTTANIVLFLGGTLSNMRSPGRVLQLINDSMGRQDVLIYTLKLDSANSRRYFNLDAQRQSHKLNQQIGHVARLLGFEDSTYDVKQIFDEQRRARFVQMVLNVDLTLRFDIGNVEKTLDFTKGERITVWRARHQNSLDVINEFDTAGFDLLHASTTPDQEYLLTISKVKTQ